MRNEQRYNRMEQKGFRKQLRNNMTSAEVVLWQMLKGRQVNGLKFRRQFGVGPYVLDFYCPELRLCIELDGAYHFTPEQQAYDCHRTRYLTNEHGIRVLRFENRVVFESPASILEAISSNGTGRDILNK